MRFRSAVLGLVALGVFPHPALAGEAEAAPEAAVKDPESQARTEAAERFQKGLAFYGEGDFQLALIEFERAHQLVPDFRVLYNIGQVAIQLGRFARARTALEAYLREGNAQLDEERRAAVSKDLEMLRGRTAFLVVSGAPDGAEVLIDELPQGETPLAGPLLLDAGEHRVVVRKPKHRLFTRWLTLAGAERLELSAVLEADSDNSVVGAQPGQVQPVSEPTKSAEGAGSPYLTAGWVAAGSLAAGALATGIAGLVHANDLQALRAEPDPDRSALEAKSAQASTWFLATDILAATALATAGVTLYFTLAQDNATSHSTTSASMQSLKVGVGPGSVRLFGTF